MDKVKPYLFYIICGVLLIAEFVVMAMFGPSHEKAQGRTVADTKSAADRAFEGKLKKPGKISGIAHPADNRNFEVRVRLSRLEKLD